jgi:hypothetical protein
MSTPYLSAMQVASVLGIPMYEVLRLVRLKILRRHKVENKVAYFDAADVHTYIRAVQS